MSRTAEYSIKGYLYQFLRYLSDILAAAKGTKVTIEGAIEDIDIIAPEFTMAVQCKYHEQAEKFTLGKIYRPILLMLEHFSNNPDQNPTIHYRLFCHFQGQSEKLALTKGDLEAVLATKSEPLRTICSRIAPSVDQDVFLKRFEIEFGPTIEDLQKQVIDALQAKGFSREDAESIILPCAIQRIVDMATQPGIPDRTVDPPAFLSALRDVRTATVTRWTRELTTRATMFRRLREELRPAMAHNTRARVFVVEPASIEKFDEEIVQFIKKLVEKYSSKFLHSNPPLFMITGDYNVAVLQTRLYDAGLSSTTGMVGSVFRIENLYRPPMRRRNPIQLEFRLRLAHRATVAQDPLNTPDELFLINVMEDAWEQHSLAVHRFQIERLSELEYVLQLRSRYA